MVGASMRNSVLETRVPEWFNLVIWGHEHESIPYFVTCEQTGVDFLQPGSTTYTSLIDAESKPKHCFILTFEHTNGSEFQMDLEAVPLRTLRPFLYNEIVLNNTHINKLNENQLIEHIKSVLLQMISDVASLHTGNPKVPMLRLKIDHSDYAVIARHKITNYFTSEQIANLASCLQFRRRKPLYY